MYVFRPFTYYFVKLPLAAMIASSRNPCGVLETQMVPR